MQQGDIAAEMERAEAYATWAGRRLPRGGMGVRRASGEHYDVRLG
jgi:hypothetical protein